METQNKTKADEKAARKKTATEAYRKRISEAFSSIFSIENMLRRKTPKSKEEILSNGTAREKVFLFIADNEALITKGKLTDEEYNTLFSYLSQMRAKNSEDEKEALFLIEGYQAFVKITDDFESLFHTHQMELYNLGRLFEKWRAIEEKGEAFNRLYKKIIEEPFTAPELKEVLHFYIMDTAGEGINCCNENYNGEVRFSCNVEMKDKLIDEICAQYNKVERALQRMKAYIVAIDELLVFLKVDTTERGFLPITMAEIIDDVTEELTLDRMEIEDLYRQSNLRKKRAAKEKISRREREKALFPDYENVDKDEHFYEKAKKALTIEIFV